ncbi:MAG: PQQ-binding-like beta-propeller repeat protein [Planctomycetaceae bacterium]|nr:PQQ-binding-like beta-propeller repeat protein [Planctomycetaceae bacterium]
MDSPFVKLQNWFSEMRSQAAVLIVLSTVVVCLTARCAVGQNREGMTIVANPVGLADRHVPLLDHEDLQLITAANGMLAQQDYLAALDRMDRLRLRAAGKLVPVAAPQLPTGYRRFVSVDSFSHAWHARFAQHHQAIWKEHQTRMDRFADQTIAASGVLEPTDVHRLLTRWPLSSRTFQWRIMLGDTAFQTGQQLAARMYWQAATRSFPQVNVDLEYDGVVGFLQRPMTRSEQQALQVRMFANNVAANMPLAARATLATIRSASVERFTEVDADKEHMNFQFGGRVGKVVKVLEDYYSQHFPEHDTLAVASPVETFQRAPQWTQRIDLSDNPRLEVAVQRNRSHLFLNTVDKIIAVDIATGLPAWGTGKEGYVIYEHGDSENDSDWYDKAIPYWGRAQATVEISGDLLLARIGDPTATHHQSLGAAFRSSGAIVALDLSTQGKLLSGYPVYANGAKENRLGNWTFVSSPKIVGDLFYVLMRETTVVQCRNYLVCYSLHSGREKWRTYLGGARAVGHQKVSTLEASHLVIAGDRIVTCCNTGEVACVSLAGQLLWLNHYAQNTGIADDTDVTDLEQAKPRHTSIVVDAGSLGVTIAAADNAVIFQLDLFSGAFRWITHESQFLHSTLIPSRREIPGACLLLGNGLFYYDRDGRFQSALNSGLSVATGEVESVYTLADDGTNIYVVTGDTVMIMQRGITELESGQFRLELVAAATFPTEIMELLNRQRCQITFSDDYVTLFAGKTLLALSRTKRKIVADGN